MSQGARAAAPRFKVLLAWICGEVKHALLEKTKSLEEEVRKQS